MRAAATASALACVLAAGACSTTPTFVPDGTGAGGHGTATSTSAGTGGHVAGASSAAGPSTTSSAASTSGASSGATTTTTSSATSAATTSATSAASSTATSASSSSGCTPGTCAASQCGAIPDGCGGMAQCSTCGGGEVCYQNACCTPKTCAELGSNCNFPADGCGGTADCGFCPEGQGCGSGGVPNHCSPVSTTSCTGSCPPGTYELAAVTNVDCGGPDCSSPTQELICGVTGATLMSGCDFNTACPSGWQLVAPYLTCNCPGESNYFVCVPP